METIWTDIDPELIGTNHDDDNYHHHTRTTPSKFLQALDNQLIMRSLCGLERKPELASPIEKPCCPICNALLSKPCPSDDMKV
jgi:hypothetical protein